VLNVLLQPLSNIRLPLHFQLLRAYFHRYIVVVIYYSNPQKSRHPAAAAAASSVHSMILALLSKRTLRYFFDCRNNSMPPGVNPGSECESEIHLVINTCAAVQKLTTTPIATAHAAIRPPFDERFNEIINEKNIGEELCCR